MISFNINEWVGVKLTKAGEQHLLKRHNELMEKVYEEWEYKPPNKDAEGYSWFQGWNLMATFGHLLGVGVYPLPFEMDIRVRQYKEVEQC